MAMNRRHVPRQRHVKNGYASHVLVDLGTWKACVAKAKKADTARS
jgi:hypothetical protein